LPSPCDFPFAFSHDGRRLVTVEPASPASRETARVWDVASAQHVGLPLKHRARISAVAFHPDGRIVITGDAEGQVQLWKAETGEPLGSAAAHPFEIGALEFAADRKTLVVAPGASPIKAQALWLWDLGGAFSPRIISHNPWIRPENASPDGRIYLSGPSGQHNTYRMWDVAGGAEIGPKEPICSVLFRPDSKTAFLIVRESGRWVLQHWDTVANRPLGTRRPVPERDMPKSIAWQPDGKAVLLGGGDVRMTSFRLVDPDTGKPLGPEITSGPAPTVRFRPDGKTLLVVEKDGTAQLWNPTTGKPVGPPCPGAGAMIHPDAETFLARTKRRSLQFWDAGTREPLGPPIDNPYDQRPTAIVSPDGKVLLTVHPDKQRIRLWDTATGRSLGVQDGPPVQDVFVRLERAEFASGGGVVFGVWQVDNLFTNEVRTWESATGRSIGVLRIRVNEGQLLAVRPDGKAVAVQRGDIQFVEITNDRPIDPTLPRRPEGSFKLRRSNDRAFFSPDGTKLFTEQLNNGQLRDVATNRPAGTAFRLLNQRSDTTVGGLVNPAFSPDGRLLIVGSGSSASMAPSQRREQNRLAGRPADASRPATARPPGPFSVYDAITGKAIGAPLGESDGADHLVFSGDGSTLVVASSSGTAQAWSVERRQPIGPVLAHDDAIISIAPSPDGKTLLVLTRFDLSRPPIAYYWDVVSGKRLGPPLDQQGALAVGFREDRTPLLVGYGAETLRPTNLGSQKPEGQPIPLSDDVRQIDVSPDGAVVLTRSDTAAQMWDAKTGRPRGGAVPLANSASFTPEGLVLVTRFEAGSGRTTIQLWSPRTGEPLAEPIPKVHTVSPSGRKALILSDDGTTEIWDVTRGRPIGEFINLPAPLEMAWFSREDSLVFIAAVDGTGRFYDVATAQPLGPSVAHLPKTSITFSPDGRTLAQVQPSDRSRTELLDVPAPIAGSAERIVLWSQVVTGLELEPGVGVRRLPSDTVARLRQRLESLGGAPEPARNGSESGEAKAPSKPEPTPPDGQAAHHAGPASSNPSNRLEAKPEGVDGHASLTPPLAPAPSVRSSPSVSTTPARARGEGSASKKGSNPSEPTATRAAHRVVGTKPGSGPMRVPSSGAATETSALIFTPDGTRVVGIVVAGGNRAKWFDARTGEEIPAGVGKGCPQLDASYVPYPSLAFSPDGRRLAWGAHAQIWDMATERKRSGLMPHSFGWAYTYSADGRRLIFAGQREVVECDAEQGKPIRRFAAEGSARAFSPDATRFATLLGAEIQIWDVSNGRKLVTLKEQGSLYARSVAFSPDNRRLVTAQGGKTVVNVWDAVTGNLVVSLDDHTKPVWSVTFSPDGRYIATAGEDARVKVWNSQTGDVVWTFDEDSGKVTSVAFSPDGSRLVALNGQARLRIWNAEEWAK